MKKQKNNIMANIKPKADYLFECSWEVCNKVGGIYTVITSKASIANSLYKNYFLVGPYFDNKIEFEEKEVPQEFIKIFEELNNEGIVCHFGEWNIKGKPKTILVDFRDLINKKNDLKREYWKDFKIDSLNSGWEFEEPMIWSTAVGMLLEKISLSINKPIVAHFHEWLSSFALLYLKQKNIKIGTVFTTHASMLGRTLAGNGRDLYNELNNLDPSKEAYNYNVQAKHLTEKASALNADVFTTVSKITSMEVEKLLGKKPDILLPNGLDIDKFPTFEETSISHIANRERIKEFIRYYFFPYYTFDIEKTLLFFIAGRYEYKNKGIDIFIKSLGRLNKNLIKDSSQKTVIALFFIPRDVFGAKLDVSENKVAYKQIRDLIIRNREYIETKISDELIISKSLDKCHNLFSKEFLQEIKKIKHKFNRSGNPPLTTHNIPNEVNDLIIKGFIENGLDNKEENKVKVIYYPIYLTGVDGLLDLSYYDTISGCHLGIFPSYYEPWGYTPLETAALGVASLTTDYSGLGRFILSKKPNSGIFVLKRFNRKEEETIEDFTKILYDYSKLNKQERVELKVEVKKLSMLTDWKKFIEYYIKAHNLAIDKVIMV